MCLYINAAYLAFFFRQSSKLAHATALIITGVPELYAASVLLQRILQHNIYNITLFYTLSLTRPGCLQLQCDTQYVI
jgi:K+ transporter